MKLVTRERPKVDRIACPWLVERFIGPHAEFLYAPRDDIMRVAAEQSATPYDVPDVELGHHGEFCSFDAFLDRFQLTDPTLHKLARIVRGADTGALISRQNQRVSTRSPSGYRALLQTITNSCAAAC